MGKKVVQSSPSSSKTSKLNNEKKQVLNNHTISSSLFKALRPKVYITDILSFRQLVQELTGNSNTNTNGETSSSTTTTMTTTTTTNVSIEQPMFVEEGVSSSLDVSIDSSQVMTNQVFLQEEVIKYNQSCYNYDDHVSFDEIISNDQDRQLVFDDEEILSIFGGGQDFEFSYVLFDNMDPFPFCNDLSHVAQEDVSIYDYI